MFNFDLIKRNWLYGEVASDKTSQQNQRKNMKGWFPARAVKYDDKMREMDVVGSVTEKDNHKKEDQLF